MNRTAVEQIKDRLPIDEVVGQYVKLEKAGKSLKARCPFHNEKSASFFVSPDRGGYYCFGCGAKGDIFSFVEQFEGLDFRGALKILAERAGVQLVFDQKADGERDQLFRIMEEAAQFFEQQFEKSTEAQKYIQGRGITEETRRSFRIGWTPLEWRNLHAYLKGKKYSDLLIEKAGLAKKGEKGPDFYDRFRGRVMFPIFDSSGRVIAFTGRILVDDGKSAKYLNSPDTPLYDKSLVLYGLDRAKSEIRQRGFSILVEGQMDLVMSHQAGVKNTVAASGTALTDESMNESGAVSNLGLVRRLSPNVIIAFDSDSAGRKAALRAAGIGLSMGMDVKIADLPEGKDPADMVHDDVESWKNALRAAKPIIEFELGNVLRDNPDPRKVPRALRDRVFPFLARIDSAMDQAHFVKMIADRAHITDDAVWQDLRATEKVIKTAAVANSSPASTNSKLPVAKVSTSAEEKISAHVDMVQRRMIGLLALMEAGKSAEAATYREQIKSIAGQGYDELLKKTEQIIGDLQFEAEAFFGTDQEKWNTHMKELVLNFEETIIADELIHTMHQLRLAEKAGESARMGELAKRCQELSMKKAEVAKKRRG
ncbi:MAG: DNA primase [Patescibacteria group bacterium]